MPAADPALVVSQAAALAVGFVASTAALYGRYRVLPSVLTGPQVCRLEAGGCQILFRTRTASLLGVPNASLSLILYGLVLVGRIRQWPAVWLLGGATLALGMSIYLGWYLIAHHLECRVCWAGHVANLGLWLTLLGGEYER